MILAAGYCANNRPRWAGGGHHKQIPKATMAEDRQHYQYYTSILRPLPKQPESDW
jgi:hypothetical protein